MAKVSEKKRAAIRRYQDKNRRTVTVDLSKEMFDRYEKKCAEEGIAKAAVLRAAIELFIEDEED